VSQPVSSTTTDASGGAAAQQVATKRGDDKKEKKVKGEKPSRDVSVLIYQQLFGPKLGPKHFKKALDKAIEVMKQAQQDQENKKAVDKAKKDFGIPPTVPKK
jgi:hypothetical protein